MSQKSNNLAFLPPPSTATVNPCRPSADIAFSQGKRRAWRHVQKNGLYRRMVESALGTPKGREAVADATKTASILSRGERGGCDLGKGLTMGLFDWFKQKDEKYSFSLNGTETVTCGEIDEVMHCLEFIGSAACLYPIKEKLPKLTPA